MDKKESALVVLSGGQDSTTCLFWAKERYAHIDALTINYNQRHSRELEAAQIVGRMAGVRTHHMLAIGSILQGRSPLTNKREALETYTDAKQMAETIGDRVELTFVPMRNSLFLTLAANVAVCSDITDIVTGVCEADNANYPDCRRSFIMQQEDAINYALGNDIDDTDWIHIHTPLIQMSKADSIRLAMTLPGCMDALAYSHTAYSGEYPPSTQDHATVLRALGFEEAGVPDPLIVRAWEEGLMPLPMTHNYALLRAGTV
jgi:7-cyano-7-deazaguanine synthase